METTELSGEVDRIGPDQVRVRLDGEAAAFAFVPRGVIPSEAGRRLKIGARISVTIRRHGEGNTEEWIVRMLPDRPTRYSVRRGQADAMTEHLGPQRGPGKKK